MRDGSSIGAPRTSAGRRLLDRCFACCTARAVVEVEDEARREFLDDLIATGAVVAPMSYQEIEEALARHRLRLIAALYEQQKGQEAPSNLGGSD